MKPIYSNLTLLMLTVPQGSWRTSRSPTQRIWLGPQWKKSTLSSRSGRSNWSSALVSLVRRRSLTGCSVEGYQERSDTWSGKESPWLKMTLETDSYSKWVTVGAKVSDVLSYSKRRGSWLLRSPYLFHQNRPEHDPELNLCLNICFFYTRRIVLFWIAKKRF